MARQIQVKQFQENLRHMDTAVEADTLGFSWSGDEAAMESECPASDSHWGFSKQWLVLFSAFPLDEILWHVHSTASACYFGEKFPSRGI